MTSKVVKDEQKPAEADTEAALQSFYFPEYGVSVEAATLEEATEIAKNKKGGSK